MSYRTLFYILFCLNTVPALAQDNPSDPSLGGTGPVLPAPLKELQNYMETQPDMDFQTTYRSSSNVLDTKSQGSSQFLTRRPNLFRVSAKIGGNTYEYVSDGTLLTIYNHQTNEYAEAAARASITGNMTFIAGLMSFQARLFDLLAALDQAALGGGVKVAPKGTETVGGRECDRFNVMSQVETWDVWVEKASPHLPCKLVSGDVDDPAVTTQINEFTWKKAPNFDAATFKFVPPAGSKRVDVGDLLAGQE